MTADESVAAVPKRAKSMPAPLPKTLQPLDEMDSDEWLDWFHRLPEESRVNNRDFLMVEGLESGLTLHSVGDLYGVTRERVRQIAAQQGLIMKELRKLQREQSDRRARRVARHIYGVSLTHPELTLEELADWAEADEETVRRSLEHRVVVHEVRVNDWASGISDEELLTALRTWAGQESKHTGDNYTAWAELHGFPGRQTAQNRFGGWNNALEVAGLGHLARSRGGRRPVISDEEIWGSILLFFRDDLQSYSYASYDKYASERELPSGALARTRLGSWSEVKVKVRELLRYAADRDGRWAWAEAILAVVPGGELRNQASSEDATASLQRVAQRMDGLLSLQAYEAARLDSDVPANLIQRRLGSWVNALVTAGLTDRLTRKGRGRLESGEYGRAVP